MHQKKTVGPYSKTAMPSMSSIPSASSFSFGSSGDASGNSVPSSDSLGDRIKGAVTSIIEVDSTEFVNMGAGGVGVGVFYLNGGGITSSSTFGTQSIKNCSFNDCGVALYLTLTGTTTTSYYNVIVDNCVYNTRITTGALFYQPTAPTGQPALAVNSYISNNCIIFGGTSSAISGITCFNNTIDIENNRVSRVSNTWGYQYGQATTYVISEKFNNNIARSNLYGFFVFFRDTLDTGFHPTGNKSIRNTYGWTIYGSVNSRIDNLTSIGNTTTNLYGSINTVGSNKLYLICLYEFLLLLKLSK